MGVILLSLLQFYNLMEMYNEIELYLIKSVSLKGTGVVSFAHAHGVCM